MKYSIIFLVKEENEQFSNFLDLIFRLFEKKNEDFEIVIAANATEDFLRARLSECTIRSKELKIISFQRAVSQSLCLKSALKECSGEYILTLGHTQELIAADYENIIDSMTAGTDMVVPYRKDSLLHSIHSRTLNKAIKKATGVTVNDIGCSVKFFRREVLDSLNLYGNMYRYLPVFALQKGFRIKEIECKYFQRAKKVKFYRPRLYFKRLIEILNLFFSSRFSKKPLRFFNLVGIGLILIGILLLTVLSVQKVVYGIPIGNRNLLLMAIIILVTGTQTASFGLLGEMLAFIHGRSQKEYSIEEII